MNVLKLSLLILLTLSFCTLTVGQLDPQTIERCGSTIQAHQGMMDENPEYKQRVKEWRKKVDDILKYNREHKNPTCTNGPLLIPVAVHFDSGIVPAAQEACAITIVEEQIAEMNLEILGLDSDASLINQFTSCFGSGILGDACMEFCLATQNHPSGYGLINGDVAVTFGQVSFSVPSGNFTPVNADWADYVNIYVDNLSGGLLGVSNGIPGNFNGDGVLVDNCVFGTGAINCPGVQTTGSSGCFATYDEGETLAHELGHYFGLYHIWGDNGNCNGSQDMIDDTPDMRSSYSGYLSCGSHTTCSDLPTNCGSEDMYMNFMSYAGDACMYMFTSDQSDVMNATAVAEGYTTSSSKCTTNPPVANFEPVGQVILCGGDCIAYVDLSTDDPTEWDWTFTVTAGNLILDSATSTEQNPLVCVTSGTAGTVSTTLVATNAGGSDTFSADQMVTVSTGTSTWYLDADMDGYGDPNISEVSCPPVAGYVLDNTDCDDNDPNINPGATEICDGIDNNCDLAIDEGVTTSYYLDNDGDGFGDNNMSIEDCSLPAGYVIDNTDCDDNDSNNYPGNVEVCDGQDNNCDGLADEGLPTTTYFADNDGDGFGDSNVSLDDCSQPAGYVINDTDCDDNDSNNYPGNTEVCDGSDNNCDGIIDEGVTTSYFADTDGDNYGDPDNSTEACSLPTGFVTDNTDCDDTDPNINPGATEIPDNGIDEDCDGMDEISECATTITQACDDGDPCTINDTEEISSTTGIVCEPCAGTLDESSCNLACVTTQPCDDGDPCTIDDEETIAGDGSICVPCAGTTIDCSSGSTTEQACDDGNPATTNDIEVVLDCDGSICIPCQGTPPAGNCDAAYLVINSITMNTYHAEINVTSDALLDNGQSILFTAGTDIDLDPGFEVVLGTTFEARIEPCTPFAPGGSPSKRAQPGISNLLELDHLDKTVRLQLVNKDGIIINNFDWNTQSAEAEFSKLFEEVQKGFYKLTVQNGAELVEYDLLLIK